MSVKTYDMTGVEASAACYGLVTVPVCLTGPLKDVPGIGAAVTTVPGLGGRDIGITIWTTHAGLLAMLTRDEAFVLARLLASLLREPPAEQEQVQ